MAWLVVGVVLAAVAFGFRGLTGGGRVAAALALAHADDIFRLAGFAGLGLLALFGSIWLWGEIRNRHTLEDIGIFVTSAGIVGFLLLLGGYVLKVDLGNATGWLFVGSSLLVYAGLRLIRVFVPAPSPSPVARQGRSYHRKAVTTYGDARSAEDREIDKSLSDKGGFDPMFKD